MTTALNEILHAQLAQFRAGVSIGGFGAVAEFQEEAAEITQHADKLIATSSRGSLCIQLNRNETALAYEMPSQQTDCWQYGLALLGDAASSTMSGRTVLTELGEDKRAICARENGAVLFDIGVGLPHVEFCVRTTNAKLLACLRKHVGTSVIDQQHPVIKQLIEVSPHRVMRSRIARIEVYQRIDTHKTPPGPHTHLLPDLLSRRRIHSAVIPIPPTQIPLLTVHPENPLFDALGTRRPFVGEVFNRFEQLLANFGNAEYVEEKRRVRAAIAAEIEPEDYPPAGSRIARLAQRITLRQLCHTESDKRYLQRWQTQFRN